MGFVFAFATVCLSYDIEVPFSSAQGIEEIPVHHSDIFTGMLMKKAKKN
jgi:hypothetical protein